MGHSAPPRADVIIPLGVRFSRESLTGAGCATARAKRVIHMPKVCGRAGRHERRENSPASWVGLRSQPRCFVHRAVKGLDMGRMSSRPPPSSLPTISGDQLVRALERFGWESLDSTPALSRLRRRSDTLVVPRDAVLNRTLLTVMLQRAGVTTTEFIAALR